MSRSDPTPPATRPPPPGRSSITLPRGDALSLWLVFGALSAAWGSSFLFIKIGLEEGLPPLTLVTFRLLIAIVFLTVVLRLTRGRLPREPGTILRLAALGLIHVAIPFGLVTWGELWIPSALASILNGLVPLFTIVLAALLLRDEPITSNRLAGLVIGFVGAALLEVIRNSLLMAGVDSNWQGAFVGVFIVLAVLLEKFRGRRRG